MPQWPAPDAAYLHVPFCARRCGYCNFTLVAGRDDLIEPYLQAIATELSWLVEPRPVSTIFIGGGTPTHLPPAALDRLLGLVRQWFPLVHGGEFSVEANPTNLDSERSAVLTAHGVNRISLGGQSLNATKLVRLERDHVPDDVRSAVRAARQFARSVSLDLIFAAPDETLGDWRRDLDDALALNVDHLSTYGLTIERGTSFYGRRVHGQLPTVDDEVERAMYVHAIDRLTAAGFEHYEVSNFARPGFRCRHNEVYWSGRSFYAAGPGAARYVEGRREVNHRSTTAYLARLSSGQSPVAESEELPPDDRAREALVLGLRRLAGVDRAEFAAVFGFSVEELAGREIAGYVDRGLLDDDDRGVRLTRAGLLVSDSLWPALLRR